MTIRRLATDFGVALLLFIGEEDKPIEVTGVKVDPHPFVVAAKETAQIRGIRYFFFPFPGRGTRSTTV